jgi:hypothetical protein
MARNCNMKGSGQCWGRGARFATGMAIGAGVSFIASLAIGGLTNTPTDLKMVLMGAVGAGLFAGTGAAIPKPC